MKQHPYIAALQNQRFSGVMTPEQYEEMAWEGYDEDYKPSLGKTAGSYGVKSEEKSFLDYLNPLNLFTPSEEDVLARERLKNQMFDAALKGAQDSNLTIDDFKFNENNYVKDKILEGIAGGILTINNNEHGGYDIYRVVGYTPDSKPIRESKPIAFTNDKGEIKPYEYTVTTITNMVFGSEQNLPVEDTRKLSHKEVEATARADIESLNKQSGFWRQAARPPLANIKENIASMLTGTRRVSSYIGDKGDIGSEYEQSKQYGRMANTLAQALAVGVLTGGVGASPLAIGAIVGGLNTPEYLSSAALGYGTWGSAFGKALADVGFGALTMGAYSSAAKQIPIQIAKAISSGGNPIATAARQLVKLNAVQSVLNAGNVLADMYMDALGSGNPIDLNKFGIEFVTNAGVTIGLNLAFELIPGISGSYGLLRTAKSGAEFQSAIRMLESATPENRAKLEKLWNYISDNFDARQLDELSGASLEKQIISQGIAAEKAGVIDKWDSELIKQMKLAGYVKNTSDARTAKELISSIREMHEGIESGGEAYKVKYDAETNRFYYEKKETAVPGEQATNTRTNAETNAEKPKPRTITEEDVKSVKQNIESSMVAMNKKQKDEFLNQLVELGLATKTGDGKIDFGEKTSDILDILQHFKDGESLLRIIRGVAEPKYHNPSNPSWMSANDHLTAKTTLDPVDNINVVRAKNELGSFYDDAKNEIIRRIELATGHTPSSASADIIMGKIYGISGGEGSVRQKFIEKFSTIKDGNYAGVTQESLLTKFKEYFTGISEINTKALPPAPDIGNRLLLSREIPTYEKYLAERERQARESRFANDLSELPMTRVPTDKDIEIENKYPALRSARIKETGTVYPSENIDVALNRAKNIKDVYNKIDEQMREVEAEQKIPTRKQIEEEAARSKQTQEWMSKTRWSENTGFTKLKKIANKKAKAKLEKAGSVKEIEPGKNEEVASGENVIKDENKLIYKNTEPTKEEIDAIIKDEPEIHENEKIEESVNNNFIEEATRLEKELKTKVKEASKTKIKTITSGEKTDTKKIKQKDVDKQVAKILDKIEKKIEESPIETSKQKAKSLKIQEKMEKAEANLRKAEEEFNATKAEFLEKKIIDKQGILIGGGAREEARWNKVYSNLKKARQIANAVSLGESIKGILGENKSTLIAGGGLILAEALPDDDEYSELKNITRTASIFGIAKPLRYGSKKFKFVKDVGASVASKIGYDAKIGATQKDRIASSPMFKEWTTKGIWQRDGSFKKLTHDEAMDFVGRVIKAIDTQARKGFTVLAKMKDDILGYKADVKENNNPLEKDYYRYVAKKGLQGQNEFNAGFKQEIKKREIEFHSSVRRTEDIAKIIHVNDVIRRKIIDINLKEKSGNIDSETARQMKEMLVSENNIKAEFKRLNNIPDEYKAAWDGKTIEDKDVDFLYQGYNKWRSLQDKLYEAERYGQIADALGLAPGEFASFKERAKIALEDYSKSKKEIRELRESFKELRKLAPSPETPEFQRLFEITQKIKELAKRMKVKIDGKDYQQLRTALKWVEHMDDFLENSSLNQYMDMRTTWRGLPDDSFNYGLKVVEATRAHPKSEKLAAEIKKLEAEDIEDPKIIRKIEQKRQAWNLAEKEREEARKVGEDFYDVPPDMTDQKFMYKFKNKKERDASIEKMFADRNAKEVTSSVGGKKHAIYEMDAVDMYGRKLTDVNGNVIRKLYRINDSIDFSAMHYAITSRDALKTMLYRAIKDGGLNWSIKKAMGDKLDIIEMGLKNLESSGDEIAYRNISDSVQILRRILEGENYPQSTLKEALENLTRYKPPDAYQTHNFYGNSPIAKKDYENYVKNIKNITQDRALLGLERGLTMKAVDDVLTENMQMGLTQTKLFEDMLNFRDYFYQRPTNYAIWKRNISEIASNALTAVQRLESGTAMMFNVGTMIPNHIYAVLDIIGTSNNPVLQTFKFAKNYFRVIKIAYDKGVELSARQLSLMGVPLDKIKAFKDMLTKDGIRVFGKPETDSKGNLTESGLQTHIKNQIANLMIIRDIGSSSPTQSAFHNNLTKIEDVGYTPTKVIEFINRNLSAMMLLDDVMAKNPYDPKAISIEDYVKWVGDEIQLYAGKTNGIFTPLYNSKVENLIMKIPGGRSLVMLSRPFMKSLYNIYENIHTLIYGGALTDAGNKRVKAASRLLARGFAGWLLAGSSAVPVLVDAIDVADRIIKDVNKEKEDPSLIKESFREMLHRKVREWARGDLAAKIFGKKLSENDLDNLIIALEKGLPGLLGIGLNIDERTGSLLDPYILQAIDKQLSSIKKVGTGGMSEESLEALYRAFIPSGGVRASEAINQMVSKQRMTNVGLPFHSESYKELNKLNMGFSYGDALKYFIFGRPAKEKLALEMKYSPGGENRELISEAAQRTAARQIITMPGIEFRGIGLSRLTKDAKAEIILSKTKLKDNPLKLYDMVQAVYSSDKYQSAINKSQEMINNIIQKNPAIVRKAAEKTIEEVAKVDTKDVKTYIDKLKKRVNQYYYIKATHEVLSQNMGELIGDNVSLSPLFKRKPVFAFDLKKSVYLDKTDFDKQGLYYAFNSLDENYKNISMPRMSSRRRRRQVVEYEE